MAYKPKEYKKENYIAVYSDTAFSGVGIIDIEYGIDDKVVYQTIVGEKASKVCKSKIRYNKDGSGYFTSNGIRYRLDNFIRV